MLFCWNCHQAPCLLPVHIFYCIISSSSSSAPQKETLSGAVWNRVTSFLDPRVGKHNQFVTSFSLVVKNIPRHYYCLLHLLQSSSIPVNDDASKVPCHISIFLQMRLPYQHHFSVFLLFSRKDSCSSHCRIKSKNCPEMVTRW